MILGLNSIFHDASACTLGKGQSFAVEEERLTGIKHAIEGPLAGLALPYRSIAYCLAESKAHFSEVMHLAYSLDPDLCRNGDRAGANVTEPPWHSSLGWMKVHAVESLPVLMRKCLPRALSIRQHFVSTGESDPTYHFVEHHLSHAASTFFASSFDQAAIASIDGIGETTCTLLAFGEGSQIRKLRSFEYPNSLGFFYEEITKFLGFQRNNDECKVMGLSALGRPAYKDALRRLIRLNEDGGYNICVDFEHTGEFGAQELHEILGNYRFWHSKLKPRHADIAASAQAVLEDTVLHMLTWLHEKTGSKNLCLAGGVALNCVLNERIRRDSPFERIFVQPAAHDAGTALGAALYVNHAILGRPREFVMEHAYLGPEFFNEEIESKLMERKIPFYHSDDAPAKAAEMIAGGKVIGWFQGRMEWGPRALGNRSILADPRDPRMKDKVNHIKGREDFQPFAPAILEEATREYFECGEPSPFMLFARKVKSGKTELIPSVVHVDGTARVQTVNREINPRFYDLIGHFAKRTEIPVVLNTSLNRKGKPIVCTVEQALDCFFNTGLDAIFLGDFLVEKHPSARGGG